MLAQSFFPDMIQQYAHDLIEFVRVNQMWAAPIVGLLAFAESLAFMSLLVPAWAALVGIGALIGAGGLEFWPIWVAAAVGAALGDWLSYWLGFTFKDKVAHVWPLSRYPDLLPRGEAFIRRFGVFAVAIGRFFGPLRASVPLVAGIFVMPWWHFQLANFGSAFLWAAVLLAPGTFGVQWLT
ncbi:MAG: DedA family protein [Xanthobacteraceae bacterium]